MSDVQIGPKTPHYSPHFETYEQKHESDLLGMWLFLAQEIMFFGGLFTAYAVYRFRYPDVWAEGSRHLNRWIGGGNTVVLLVSSLTMALTVYYTQRGRLKPLLLNLFFTLSLGTTFLIVKIFEWKDKFEHGLIPGVAWHPEHVDLADPSNLQLFYVLYFTMTGMHALHMIIGVAVGLLIFYFAARKTYGPNRYMPVELFGFYWHFVDIVWVFLFPMYYLIPPFHGS